MSTNRYPSSKTIKRHVLENGIIVLVYENPYAQTVVLDGGLWAGALNETHANAGVASFTTSMLMRGTRQHSFDAIYDELEAIGATLSFGSGYLMTTFSGQALAEDFSTILSLLAQSLRYPTFPAEQIEKIRAEKLTSIMMRENDTRSMARLTFNELLFGEHPYGRSVSGYADSVSAIGRDALVRQQARFAPDGMVLTVVGGVDSERVIEQIEAAFGDWRNPDFAGRGTIPNAPRPAEVVRTHYAMPNKTQSDIILGLPGPRRHVPDYMDARLANTVLGVFGMMGRLGKNVREKQGLAYYARSALRGGLGPSAWVVSTGVAPDKVEQAIASCRDEIRRIQDELVPADELADTVAYLKGSLPMAIETNGGIATNVTNMEVYDLGMDYLVNYRELVGRVSAESLQQAAQKYFSADEIAIAVAGP